MAASQSSWARMVASSSQPPVEKLGVTLFWGWETASPLNRPSWAIASNAGIDYAGGAVFLGKRTKPGGLGYYAA